MKRRCSLAWLALVCAAGCSDANVAGRYAATITYDANECGIAGWSTNEQEPTTLSVAQTGSDVMLFVNGNPGYYVAAIVGSNIFVGDVDGNDLRLADTGTAPPQTSGGCEYTLEGEVIATQDGDTMAGRVEYRAATNDHADCGALARCVSTQAFVAMRSPPVE